MENQHQKIKGYRDLSQTEIDLMNEIKAKGEELNELYRKINNHVIAQYVDQYDSPEGETELSITEPKRWVNIGRTNLQQGLMALTRAVAQPTTF